MSLSKPTARDYEFIDKEYLHLEDILHSARKNNHILDLPVEITLFKVSPPIYKAKWSYRVWGKEYKIIRIKEIQIEAKWGNRKQFAIFVNLSYNVLCNKSKYPLRLWLKKVLEITLNLGGVLVGTKYIENATTLFIDHDHPINLEEISFVRMNKPYYLPFKDRQLKTSLLPFRYQNRYINPIFEDK